MAVVNSGHLCKLGSGHKNRRAQELLQAKKKKKKRTLRYGFMKECTHFLKGKTVHEKGI